MTDAERLRQQYQQSLGRSASDAEIAGWTSGKFGGGGIDQWLGQISGSHEARQRPTYRAPLSQQAAPGAGYNTPSSSQTTNMGLPSSRTPAQNAQARASSDPYDTLRADSWGKPDYDWSRQSYEDTLRNAYKRFTGRDADAAGLAAHMNNPYGLEGAVRSIYESPESQAYKQKNPDIWGRAQPAPVTPTTTTPPVTTPGAVQPSIFQGFTPKHAMEGFAFGREQNTGKSAKDAFAFLSNEAPPPPIQDKAALGAWFKQYVEPGMNQLGHKVLSVEGDKFTFENWQGRFTVDFGRGAGAAGGALAWQVDPDTAVMGTGPYVPQQPTAPSGGAAPPLAPASTTPGADIIPNYVDPRTGNPGEFDPEDPTFRGNVSVGGQLMSDAMARQTLANTQYRRRPYQRFASSTGGGTQSPPQPSI